MGRSSQRFGAITALVLLAVPSDAQNIPPSCRLRLVNVNHDLRFGPGDGALCVEGSQAAVRLEVRKATIEAVLSALSAVYRITYDSPIELNEPRGGRYAGSLGQVISRLLEGYSYVIEHDGSELRVVVLGKKGDRAVPALTATEASRAVERVTARNR